MMYDLTENPKPRYSVPGEVLHQTAAEYHDE